MYNFPHQKPIILASGSRARQELLRSLGLDFSVVPSDCNEEEIKQLFSSNDFIELARQLAACKVRAVSQANPASYVIAADQLCVVDQQILDKPGNHETAVMHLKLLRGKQHAQISACCIAKAGEILWEGQDSAMLTLKNLDESSIENYLKHDKPYQSCGAYHYEGRAKWLFSQVIGSDSTIQGLPLIALTNALIDLGIVQL
ncbi:Maf-like protein [Legionella birminghamensis]|uniref:Nucleoside triphosphate pyrophosphatase n=1 Tax=Legionella birminghamensis TaxID=28083 RepID=A0A378IBK7_9GAMM|nr:nucleoside triphosphate pyrophosphatase [Legionella birminghamensis]KTC74480.1 Maf-like protein [Legionella birminghamensis]STX32608.1 septum formation protein [Legionella birminghamensis]